MDAALQNRTEQRMPPRVLHLLEVARAEFVAEGFDGVSIDAIARKAGVSKETIYRHFPDKQALFTASLEEMANHFTARAEAIVRSGHKSAVPVAEELAGLAEAILDAAAGGGLLSPSWLAAGLGSRMPAFAAELQAAQAARMEPVREAIADIARSKGLARAISIEDALDFGSLSVEGSALLMGFAPPSAESRRIHAARVAALFEHGIQAMPKGPAMPDRASEAAGTSPCGPKHPPHLCRLLDVSADHFLREGFDAASLGEIGAEAQVGRGTLYRHFASKAGLFDAVLRNLARQVARTASPPELPPTADLSALAGYLAQATVQMTGPTSVALHRVAISASRRTPALARAVHDEVRAPWVRPLAAWIDCITGHPDAEWLARQGVVLAMQGNRSIAAGRGPTGDALSRHALRAAGLFLNGLGG